MSILMRDNNITLDDYWKFLNEANENNEDWVPYPNAEAVRVFIFSDPLYDPEKHWVGIVGESLAADLTVTLDRKQRPEALIQLNIAKFFRGKGLGENLMKTALKALANHQGSIRIVLSEGNREIVSFAKKQGFIAETMIDLELRLEALEEPQVPAGYRIDPVNKLELRKLVDLWNEIFGSNRRLEEIEIMVGEGSIVEEAIVAYSANEEVGFCLAGVASAKNPNEGFIAQIGVRSDHRRKGIGKALLLSSLLWLKRQGCSTATVNVLPTNYPALQLYTKSGFKILRVKEKHLIRPSYLEMRKTKHRIHDLSNNH